ncbi:MAG TPA: OmpH family outer membrane protein [Candidatus Omnitrophota bacterium]|nr:OmpH family outer membrane protein [Candidatus Omnitrophota bacterium]HPB67580.1 OmpH family outer membrane protein [Candidatus Omnitrophota bacterium]HQO57225.1 OmpH family outer membrane protein [Candidatus Omnitrophota bacterium]HQP12638.1 OmpH family outer membrane protein [Candidatus Omnitrophota bacterium]
MRKLSFVICAVACALLLAMPVQAQVIERKVAFIDLSKLFDSYEKTKEYDTVLEKAHKTYETTREEKLTQIQEATGKLALMKAEEKENLQSEIDTMKKSLMEFDQAQRTDLAKQRDEKIREILLEIEKTVSDFAKKEKYDLILNDRVLIYGNETLDITEQVLTILNEAYKIKE